MPSKKTKKVTEKKDIIITSTPEKNIPKFCNKVYFAKLESGNIVMSFLFQEPKLKGEEGQMVLLDRILVEEGHAKKIVDTLNGIIN